MAAGDVEVNLNNLDAKRGPLFDGIDDIMTFPNSTLASLSKGTIMCWLKNTVNASANCVFSASQSGINTAYIDFTINVARTLTAVIRVGGVFQWQFTSTAKITADEWSHVAITHDGTEPTLWLNGTALTGVWNIDVDRTHFISSITATLNTIGVLKRAAETNYLAGTMSDIRVYNVALTEAQITSCMNGDCTADGLIHRYIFGGDYTDEVGSANLTNSGTRLGIWEGAIAAAIKAARTSVADNYLVTSVAGSQIINTTIDEA